MSHEMRPARGDDPGPAVVAFANTTNTNGTRMNVIPPPPSGKHQPPLADLLPPYPRADDAVGWVRWWDRYRIAGQTAAALDPDGRLYRLEYVGDDQLPGVRPEGV